MAIYVCRYDIGVNEKNFTVDNAKRNDQYFKNTLYARWEASSSSTSPKLSAIYVTIISPGHVSAPSSGAIAFVLIMAFNSLRFSREINSTRLSAKFSLTSEEESSVYFALHHYEIINLFSNKLFINESVTFSQIIATTDNRCYDILVKSC